MLKKPVDNGVKTKYQHIQKKFTLKSSVLKKLNKTFTIKK